MGRRRGLRGTQGRWAWFSGQQIRHELDSTFSTQQRFESISDPLRYGLYVVFEAFSHDTLGIPSTWKDMHSL
jgi:hypothetical protein